MASDIWLRTTQIVRGNPLPPHGLLFLINSKGSFICTIPDRIAHTTVFVTPVVEHWLEREIAQWVHPMKDRSDDPSHHEGTLLPRSYISLLFVWKFWTYHLSLFLAAVLRGSVRLTGGHLRPHRWERWLPAEPSHWLGTARTTTRTPIPSSGSLQLNTMSRFH